KEAVPQHLLVAVASVHASGGVRSPIQLMDIFIAVD
ncbi:hypothetical protein CCACVL1_27539, partial [Corchorus capsularis]